MTTGYQRYRWVLRLGLFLFIGYVSFGCAPGLQAARYREEVVELQRRHAQMTLVSDVESGLRNLRSLDRTALVQQVLARNPSIESARQAWRAALARYPQVTALDDPTLSYAVAPLTVGSNTSDFGYIAQLSQRFPFPGKLGLQGAVSLAEADAAREDYETVRLHLATIASQLFDDYYTVERALEINAQHTALLEDFQRSAVAQYVAGRAAQQDPIQAEVEIANLMQQRLVLHTNRDVIVAQINGLLHREAGLPLPSPPADLPIPAEITETIQTLSEQALRRQPELQASQARIRAREPAVKLSELQYYPDFAITGTYNALMQPTEKRFTAGLSLNIPLQLGRRRGALNETQARLARAQSDHTRLADKILVEVAQAYWRVLEAHRVIRLFKDRILPATNDQVRAARAGFETGRNTFLALIEAEKNQRTMELRFQETLADLYRRRAQLDRAVGRLPGLPYEGENS